MQHLQPNTTLQGGKYRIERVLGQGGFGITYLAEQTLLHRCMAIKEFFLKEENGRDGTSVTMPNTTKQGLFDGQKEKFKKEAARMFSIKNDHVIGVHDLFEENGTAYYVMDYVDGESLADRLKRTDKPIPEKEARDLLPQILDALKAVHKEGFCHLDLKPSNIMVDKDGHVKLIDFGASKQIGPDGSLTTNDPTAFAQTPGYAPPEQMEQNKEKIGPWTDIYALGATLYAILTNKKPPHPSDINDDMSADKHLALPGLNEVSTKMHHVILRLLNPNWKERPQNVEEISSMLKRINNIPNSKHTKDIIEALDEVTFVEAIGDDNDGNVEKKTAKRESPIVAEFPKTQEEVNGKTKDGQSNKFVKFIKDKHDILIPGIVLIVALALLIWHTNHFEEKKENNTASFYEESIVDGAERDAELTTAKCCPMRLNDEGTLILERITFDKSTRVWKQDFLLDAAPETLEQIDMRDILLKDLKNQPSYKPYMESKFIFQYVYCDMKNPTDTLVDIRLTPKDYE